MMKSDPQLVRDLFALVSKLPTAKREEVREEILRLRDFVGSDDDLFIDRRKLTWLPGGSARVKVDSRTKIIKEPQLEKEKYLAIWRGENPIPCTLNEAAKYAGKPKASLSAHLNKGKGRYDCVDTDGDLLTIQRI